ncbi:hypothetical protein [Sporolactobacillus terrae]|uniref:hypothetical protein n=1 Tax=Sporolactobacillus terrae TaxID=269673 RepID=UPI000ACDCD01|nr:hypothetical protein [Sporolactobacillus terrae]
MCGNSLCGALANAVAVHHKNVRAVTLDPAILPEGMVKTNHKYPNVTNYFTKYDGLTRGELGLNLSDRFPGKIAIAADEHIVTSIWTGSTKQAWIHTFRSQNYPSKIHQLGKNRT